ncbi:MAG: hypothetical protein R2939_13270 [Kofleriaceae bacterium]
MTRARHVPLALALVLSAPAAAVARPASTGYFAEAGFGAAVQLGEAGQSTAPGPQLAVRVGYEPWSWLALGIQLAASSHEATVPAPPEGEWYQLYRGAAEVRLTGRLDRLALMAEGGLGAVYISSNVLEKVAILEPGEALSLAVGAGAGLEYQLENRHYALGLAGDWWLLPAFASTQAVEGRVYLRYTY